ncbi:hypothetical protein SAMN02745136_05665 [Anaerocolumna jejuensis DSM 15929]|uniref:Uncharacterized protein n=1 Tax=Anaerocolumna jejuensis DSM 15929 TaxID=1121322 RepID=A0A1M7DCS6_9FIRM|nr:hypothetical protein SAMN02745136_05665 [Anaerocolumna jejuensis DSM 15929]
MNAEILINYKMNTEELFIWNTFFISKSLLKIHEALYSKLI